MKAMNLLMAVVISASVAASGVVHADLYIHGYRDIPTIGPAFLWQGSAFCAMAVLILVGAPSWLRLAAAAAALGSLTAFALSRTVGLFGFSETGWQPVPYALASVVAELLTIVLVGAGIVLHRRRRQHVAVSGQPAAHDASERSLPG